MTLHASSASDGKCTSMPKYKACNYYWSTPAAMHTHVAVCTCILAAVQKFFNVMYSDSLKKQHGSFLPSCTVLHVE